MGTNLKLQGCGLRDEGDGESDAKFPKITEFTALNP
jgi:hypothetical protein